MFAAGCGGGGGVGDKRSSLWASSGAFRGGDEGGYGMDRRCRSVMGMGMRCLPDLFIVLSFPPPVKLSA